MTKEEFQQLFKEKIIPESKNPYHFEALKDSTHNIEAYNPMCGDKYSLFINEDSNIIESAYFDGIGCSISKASISLLLKNIEGKSREEIIKICKHFLASTETENTLLDFPEDAIEVLIALKNFEGRMDCVKLGWESLIKYLENNE